MTCFGAERGEKTEIICDTAGDFKMAILPISVSLMTDQLPSIFFFNFLDFLSEITINIGWL